MARTIVIAGSVAQKPHEAGHTWVFLQYLLGFKKLGFDVLLLDRLEPDMAVDTAGHPCPIDRSVNLKYFRDVMNQFGLGENFSLACDHRRTHVGLDHATVLKRLREAEMLVNVMGFITDREILGAAKRRVFLDIDPGFGQMWRELGLHDLFKGHDDFVTIGLNVGKDGCDVPTCGLKWITTAQPVVLEQWKACGSAAGHFSTIASWRGPFGPIEYGGKTYGLRVHEFRRFIELPKLSHKKFELALSIHPNETADLKRLNDNHWHLVDPKKAAGDPEAYQRFIRDSLAEFTVAKNLYVQTRGGWFSDRSICYLASGRPVLCQDTGLREHFGGVEGLVLFDTMDQAIAGADSITRDHERHSRAARALAEKHFDSDKVLGDLLSKLGVA